MLTNDVASFFSHYYIRFWNQFVAGPNYLQMPGSKRNQLDNFSKFTAQLSFNCSLPPHHYILNI